MGGIRVLPIVALAVAAVLAQPASAEPRGKGQIKAVGKVHGAISALRSVKSGRRDGTTIRVIRRNKGHDHRVVRIIDDILGDAALLTPVSVGDNLEPATSEGFTKVGFKGHHGLRRRHFNGGHGFRGQRFGGHGFRGQRFGGHGFGHHFRQLYFYGHANYYGSRGYYGHQYYYPHYYITT